MHSANCFICMRIDEIGQGNNMHFVKELQSGYVVIGDTQYVKGYTLLLSKHHVYELHDLSQEDKMQFLSDMSITAKAVFDAFQPNKLNYELLGNTDKHLHWHIIPRYSTEIHHQQPYWVIPKELRNAPEYVPHEEELIILRKKLLDHL